MCKISPRSFSQTLSPTALRKIEAQKLKKKKTTRKHEEKRATRLDPERAFCACELLQSLARILITQAAAAASRGRKNPRAMRCFSTRSCIVKCTRVSPRVAVVHTQCSSNSFIRARLCALYPLSPFSLSFSRVPFSLSLCREFLSPARPLARRHSLVINHSPLFFVVVVVSLLLLLLLGASPLLGVKQQQQLSIMAAESLQPSRLLLSLSCS